MKSRRKFLPVATAAVLLAIGLTPVTAMADAQINFGDTWLGVNDQGHLNVRDVAGITENADFTGLTFAVPNGGDATSPGCLCEGWGVAVNGTNTMHANEAVGGIVNMTVDNFASTASTATSVVSMTNLAGLTVTHQYQPSAADNVFEAIVTIANNTGAGVTDTRYTRVMDWDIPPTEFNEFVTIGGTGSTNLLFSNDDGFDTPNPLDTRNGGIGGCGPTTTDFVDCGASDHGALFDFGFGDLANGESVTFSIFYGGAANEADATAALGVIGAELFSFGQQAGDPVGGAPATFIFAFSGVGGEVVVPPPDDDEPPPPDDDEPPPPDDDDPTAVPEPTTLALMGIGLIGLGLRRRRKV